MLLEMAIVVGHGDESMTREEPNRASGTLFLDLGAGYMEC